MKMEAVAMIRRGWPNGGALEQPELIKAATTLVNGNWVVKQADGTVALSGASAVNNAGLVVVGNGDAASAANTNKAVVLWSGFIVDVSNFDNTATYVPGDALTVKNGILTKAVLSTGTTAGTFVPGDPVVGHVLNVVAVSTTETAHITVLVR